MNEVGNRIKKLRLARNLSQEQAARAIGVKQGSFTQLETGKSKSPAADTLVRLAHLFEVTPEWLLTGRGMKQQPLSLSIEESELVALFRSMSAEGRTYTLARLRRMAEEERATPQSEDHAAS